MDYEIVKSKSIALLIRNTKKDNDAHVYLGRIIQERDSFYFFNEKTKWKVLFGRDKFGQLKEVTENVKSIFLDADYFFSLSMADMPENAKEEYISIGIKWEK